MIICTKETDSFRIRIEIEIKKANSTVLTEIAEILQQAQITLKLMELEIYGTRQ